MGAKDDGTQDGQDGEGAVGGLSRLELEAMMARAMVHAEGQEELFEHGQDHIGDSWRFQVVHIIYGARGPVKAL